MAYSLPVSGYLADACRDVASVTVVAPDREQSGTSHSLTLHRPLRPQRRQDGAGRWTARPTDCVMLAMQALMPERPDFVFSGINHGPNMGEDVLYSGTVSAAMEAVDAGHSRRSRSRSRAATRDDLSTLPATLVTRLVRTDVAARLSRQHPAQREPAADAGERRQGAQGHDSWAAACSASRSSRMKDPWGREIFWIGGGSITWTGERTSDHAAIHEGYISVTPLHMDLTNYGLLETVRGWSLER